MSWLLDKIPVVTNHFPPRTMRLFLVLASLSLAAYVVALEPFTLAVRRDTHHLHNGTPLLEIDESQVLSEHQPTPPSYYTADWEDEGHQSRHGGLMIVHGIFMGLAFFVSWPLGVFNTPPPVILADSEIAIALRSVKHPAQGLATFSFYILCALGCAASGLYRKLTPDM